MTMTALTPDGREQLQLRLIDEEGLKLFPYHDTRGILTIGVGRNLQAKGISREEALMLLDNDIIQAETEVQNNISFYLQLNDARKIALIELVFNMGINALLGFKKTLVALEAGDYKLASQELLASLWAKEVGFRSEKIAYLIETGIL
jgi:lysozyme